MNYSTMFKNIRSGIPNNKHNTVPKIASDFVNRYLPKINRYKETLGTNNSNVKNKVKVPLTADEQEQFEIMKYNSDVHKTDKQNLEAREQLVADIKNDKGILVYEQRIEELTDNIRELKDEIQIHKSKSYTDDPEVEERMNNLNRQLKILQSALSNVVNSGDNLSGSMIVMDKINNLSHKHFDKIAIDMINDGEIVMMQWI